LLQERLVAAIAVSKNFAATSRSYTLFQFATEALTRQFSPAARLSADSVALAKRSYN